MPQLNDVQYQFLRDLGFTGTINDMTLAYLKSLGATANTIPDAYYQLFQGQWNDKLFAFLLSEGAEGGQLNDLMLSYYGGGITPPQTNYDLVVVDVADILGVAGSYGYANTGDITKGSLTPDLSIGGNQIILIYYVPANNGEPSTVVFADTDLSVSATFDGTQYNFISTGQGSAEIFGAEADQLGALFAAKAGQSIVLDNIETSLPVVDYWFSPLINDGQNIVGAGIFASRNPDSRTIPLVTGPVVVPPDTLAAYPNHLQLGNTISGALASAATSTQIPTDMTLWDDSANSTATYNAATEENRWTFDSGNQQHRFFTNSSVIDGLDYIMSAEFKKGESQFVQVAGSTGFQNFAINYDLVNGLANQVTSFTTVRDFGLIDIGDSYIVYAVAESNSTTEGRMILAKADSLNTPRLAATSDSGAFTVKYPNFAQSSVLLSPISSPSGAGSIVADRIFCPTDNFPVENVTFQFDFSVLTSQANELFHIEWANAAKDTFVARTGSFIEFTHGNDTIAVPYADLIELGQIYIAEVSITSTMLIGVVNGFEIARLTRTDTQVAEWDTRCYLGGFNTVLSDVIIRNFRVKDYTALPTPPLGAKRLSWDFTQANASQAIIDSENQSVMATADNEYGNFIAQSNVDLVQFFDGNSLPFNLGEGLVVDTNAKNIMNNSEMTITPNQSVDPAILNWVGRQITGVDTNWNISNVSVLIRAVLFVDTAPIIAGCEFDNGNLVIGDTYVISFFLKMNDNSVPVGQVIDPGGDFFNKDNTFTWSQVPNNLTDQLIEQVGSSNIYRCQCPFVYTGGLVGIQQNVTQIAGFKSGFVVTGFQLEDRGLNPTDLQRASRYIPTGEAPSESFANEYAVQSSVASGSNPTVIPTGDFVAITEFTLLNPESYRNNTTEEIAGNICVLEFLDNGLLALIYTSKGFDDVPANTFIFADASEPETSFGAQVTLPTQLKVGDEIKVTMYSKASVFTLIVENLTNGESGTDNGSSSQGAITKPLINVLLGDIFFFPTLPKLMKSFEVRAYTIPPNPQRIPINALVDDDGEYIKDGDNFIITG